MGSSHDGALVVAYLGVPDAFGEYCGFACPRCSQTSTHAAPAIDLWRCWSCDQFATVAELIDLLRAAATRGDAA